MRPIFPPGRSGRPALSLSPFAITLTAIGKGANLMQQGVAIRWQREGTLLVTGFHRKGLQCHQVIGQLNVNQRTELQQIVAAGRHTC